MNLGLIGRCDNRGIGYQTLEFHQAMRPDRTLAVILDDPLWPEDPGRFGRDTISYVRTDLKSRELVEKTVRRFLDGLDVVFAVETVYDWRLIDWATEMGVRVVVQGNPEFFVHGNNPTWSHPEWVWPTRWMLDHVPDGRLAPVPACYVPTSAADSDEEVFRVVHVAGHAAAGDRNGTQQVVAALPYLRERVHVTIVGQDGFLPHPIRAPKNVTLDLHPSAMDSRWDMYRNQHAVILPRRYGGNCLPAIEGIAAGCVAVMPDCSPNSMWPGPRIRARKGRQHRSPFGQLATVVVHPFDLAKSIDDLARDRSRLRSHRADGAEWAKNNSWDALEPMYRQILEGST